VKRILKAVFILACGSALLQFAMMFRIASALTMPQGTATGGGSLTGLGTIQAVALPAYISSSSGTVTGSGQTSVAATAFSVSAGNTLVGFVRCKAQLNPCAGQMDITDTAGNSFALRQYQTTSDGSVRIIAFSGYAASGNASDTVTATFTGATTTTDPAIIVRQYSGVDSVRVYDTGAIGQTDSTTDPTSDTFTSNWPNEVLVMGSSWWDAPKTASNSGSWINVVQDSSSRMAAVDHIVSSTQTLQQGTLHLSASSGNTASVLIGLRGTSQSPDYIHSEGFENNNLDNEAYQNGRTGGTTCAINSNTSFVHGGTYSLDCYYEILSGSSQDSNQWKGMYFATPQNHIFFHGYFYLKSPESGATAPGSVITQRKLAWFDNSDSSGTKTYDLIINSWNEHLGSPTTDNWLAIGSNTSGCSGTLPTVFDIADITWDAWHELKVEIQLNTSGNTDGSMNIWLDGSSVYSGGSMNLRGTCSDMTLWSVGRQTNQGGSEIIKEHRYWDDLAVANSDFW
jgi:hypothetical protein